MWVHKNIVCMYVCTHMCIIWIYIAQGVLWIECILFLYAYIHTYTHRYIYTYEYVCWKMCACVCEGVYIFSYRANVLYACIHAYKFMRTYIYTCRYMHVNVCLWGEYHKMNNYVFMHLCLHIIICMYIYIQI